MQRIHDFVANGGAKLSHVRATHLARLDRQLHKLGAMAVEQELGMRLQKAATRRQELLAHALRRDFVVPLSRVAAELEDKKAGIKAALRAPHKRIPRERLVRAARGMADTAERFEPHVSDTLGRPFIRDMRAATEQLQRALLARNTPARRHIEARAAVESELRKARATVRLINALIESQIKDEALRVTWRKIKRYG